MILKPDKGNGVVLLDIADYKHSLEQSDKGNGVVLLDIADYKHSLEQLFCDAKKFKKLNEDPAHNRLLNLQKYLLKLHNSGELRKEDYIKIRPKNAKPGRAHGVPKIHKHYVNIPIPIVDTIGSTHCSVGQYLTNLLNPLTHNEFTLSMLLKRLRIYGPHTSRALGLPQLKL